MAGTYVGTQYLFFRWMLFFFPRHEINGLGNTFWNIILYLVAKEICESYTRELQILIKEGYNIASVTDIDKASHWLWYEYYLISITIKNS